MSKYFGKKRMFIIHTHTHTHTHHTQVCRSGTLFRCRVMDGLPGRCILPTDVDHPFYYPSVDK